MPGASSNTVEQRSRRDSAIRRTIGALLAGRALSVTCTLIQVPIALALLGRETYGFWIALTSVTLLLNVADLGLGAGMQNEIGTALARDEPRRAAALFGTTGVILIAIAIALCGLGWPIVRWIDWAKLFHLTDPTLIRTTGAAAVAALVLFCAGLPLTAGARLANACQWGWLAGIWSAIGSALQLLAIILARHWRLDFVLFVWLAGSASILSSLGLLLHVLHRLRWGFAELRWASADDRAALARAGLHFSLLQIGATFLFNAAAPAIGAFAGAPTVAAYYVLQRLLGLFPQLQQMAIGPTWPGYTDAAVRGDEAWIRRTYRRSLLGTALGVGVPTAVLAALAPSIIPFWAKSNTLPLSWGLIGTVAVWNFVLCLGHPPAHLLGGVGRVRRLAALSTAGHVVSALAMWALGHVWGAPGVVAGLIVGYVTIGLPGSFVEARAALAEISRKRPE